MDMLGKVALVTGAAQGIGLAIAERLQKNGAFLVVADLDRERLEKWTARGALAVRADVTKEEDVKALIGAALEHSGCLDIVVNNAGICRDGLLMRMSDEDWYQVLETNLTGVFRVCRAAVRPMLKRRQGKIINISSVVGVMGNPGQTNYAASKAGVIGFSKALAKETASRNVLVNVVAPGYIETEMTGGLTPAQREQIAGLIPLQRTGTVEDVADLVSFLASDYNQYLTGQVIHCDGGLVM